EAFGMVLAEANSCARPVVGTRIGGIPHFVRPGENGLLANPGDPRDLARALGDLLAHPDEARAMGERGRQRVLRDHDWDTLVVECERVLALALAPRPAQAASSTAGVVAPPPGALAGS
ncbi:MAG: glycosyltransferase, partial [Thermoplasmatota archaeon]